MPFLRGRLPALLYLAASACLTVAFSKSATLSGTVVDASSGKAISGAIVTAGSKVTRTGSQGEFQIEGDGNIVAARAYGYSRTQIAADALRSQSLRLQLQPFTPRALYLSFWGVGSPVVRDPVLKLAGLTPVNAVVVDVKGDLGYVSFRTAVPLASAIGAQKVITIPDVRALIDQWHKRSLYAIARIVTFKDDKLCGARPDFAVRQNGKVFKDREGLAWCDPFNSDVRAYNIDLAVDAAKAGFDEIQFDYVRFPDAKGVEFSEPSTEESRPKTITSFLMQARDKLVPYNVFLSADVFGYICWNKGDTGIGQKIDEVGSALDYISPMLYPSGFMYGIPNFRDPVAHPYEIIRLSLNRARERTKLSPVRFRPWLQAFADYAFDKRQFGEAEIQAQIKAAQDFGSDGWLLWNPRNSYSASSITRTAKQLASGERADSALQTAPSK